MTKLASTIRAHPDAASIIVTALAVQGAVLAALQLGEIGTPYIFADAPFSATGMDGRIDDPNAGWKENDEHDCDKEGRG